MGNDSEWQYGGAPGWAPPPGGPIPTSNPGVATPGWQPPPPSHQAPFGPVGLAPGAPPKKNRRGKVVAIVVVCLTILGIVGLLAVVVSFLGFSYYDVWNLEQNVPANAQVNECYSDDGSGQPVDCSGPHHFEVFSTVVLDSEGERPGLLSRWFAGSDCDRDFEAYTDVAADSFTSDYGHNLRFPNEDGWADGERYGLCVAYQYGYEEIEEMIGTPLYP